MKSVIFALAAVFSMGAMAQEKVAVCDIMQAIFASDPAQARAKELEASSNLTTLQAEGESKVAKFKKLQEDKEKNHLSWDDQKKKSYNTEVEYLRADIELIQQKMKNEQQSMQQQIGAELQPVALAELDALIKEEKIDLLLRKEAVLWSGPATDVTNKLIDRINKTAGKK